MSPNFTNCLSGRASRTAGRRRTNALGLVPLLLVTWCRIAAAAEPTVAEVWSDEVVQLSFESLSPAVIEKLRYTLCDSIGVMVYTSQLDEVRRYRDATDDGGNAEATELVTGRRVPCGAAAAINAFAIHGYEIDDSNLRNQVRASCVAIPAVLACAQKRKATGRELLVGLAASYHVTDRLGTYLNRQPAGALHRKGWMPSSVCGGVGAAAGAGRLSRLSSEQLVSAIAFAAGGANGLFQYYLEGTDEKKIHVARSQQLAVESVRLAELGFRGARGSIDGAAGLIAALAFEVRRDELLADFHRFDGVLHVKPKFYSCSQGVIPWLEALAPLVEARDLSPNEVREIVLYVDQPAESTYLRKINDFTAPTSVIGAQLSVNYCVGLLLQRRSVFVDDFTDDALLDPKVLATAAKVRAVTDPKRIGQVAIRLADGRTLSASYPLAALTEPYHPEAQNYRRKFDALTSKRLLHAERDKLWNHVFRVAEVEDIDEWVTELVGQMKLGTGVATE